MTDLSGAGAVQAAELAGVPLFATLSSDALGQLARAAFVRRLGPGQVLFVTGEPSDHLYVVRSGRLRVMTTSPHGEQLVLSFAGPAEVIGELSALDRQPRSADVVAAEASVLIAVPTLAARAVLESDPGAVLAVALQLAAHVRRLTGAMSDLIFLDLPRRVAKLLLSREFLLPDGRTVSDLGGSQTMVAAQLGVSRQSLNKALSGLARRGWIEVEGQRVVLLDPRALQKFMQS